MFLVKLAVLGYMAQCAYKKHRPEPPKVPVPLPKLPDRVCRRWRLASVLQFQQFLQAVDTRSSSSDSWALEKLETVKWFAYDHKTDAVERRGDWLREDLLTGMTIAYPRSDWPNKSSLESRHCEASQSSRADQVGHFLEYENAEADRVAAEFYELRAQEDQPPHIYLRDSKSAEMWSSRVTVWYSLDLFEQCGRLPAAKDEQVYSRILQYVTALCPDVNPQGKLEMNHSINLVLFMYNEFQIVRQGGFRGDDARTIFLDTAKQSCKWDPEKLTEETKRSRKRLMEARTWPVLSRVSHAILNLSFAVSRGKWQERFAQLCVRFPRFWFRAFTAELQPTEPSTGDCSRKVVDASAPTVISDGDRIPQQSPEDDDEPLYFVNPIIDGAPPGKSDNEQLLWLYLRNKDPLYFINFIIDRALTRLEDRLPSLSENSLSTILSDTSILESKTTLLLATDIRAAVPIFEERLQNWTRTADIAFELWRVNFKIFLKDFVFLLRTVFSQYSDIDNPKVKPMDNRGSIRDHLCEHKSRTPKRIEIVAALMPETGVMPKTGVVPKTGEQPSESERRLKGLKRGRSRASRRKGAKRCAKTSRRRASGERKQKKRARRAVRVHAK